MPEQAEPPRDEPLPARISGSLAGVELTGDGTIRLRGDAAEIRLAGQTITTSLGTLEGVAFRGTRLSLFLRDGSAIHLDGSPRLGAIAHEMMARASMLPELTRELRGFGSHRAHPGSAHDHFFAPLLAARRRAERTRDQRLQLAAFGAAELRTAIDRTVRGFAAERFPSSPPDRRALEAELLELVEPMGAALDALGAAEAQLRRSDDEHRLARRRDWAASLRTLFVAADRAWMACAPVLETYPVAPHRGWWKRMFRIGAVVALALLPAAVHAQHVTLRIAAPGVDSLRALGLDVVWADGAGALVVADSADRARLVGLGIAASEVETPASRRRAARTVVVAPVVYRSFDDPVRGIAVFLDSLAAASPRVHLDTMGLSVEGRPLIVAKVGAPEDDPARPNVLFMATYHAREWAATEMALRLLRHLAQTPGDDPRLDSLVGARDIWVMPVANPDGYQYTFDTDRLWRKNRRAPSGVDLNRNHAARWALDDVGSSPNPISEIYRGTAAESEPEVQAIVAFHAAHPPDVSVSYHTYADLLLWPPGYRFGILPGDLPIFRALAGTDQRPAARDQLPGAERDHYHPAPGWNLYPTNGDYTDWAYEVHGTITFTAELTSGWEGLSYYGFEFPDDESRLQTLFADNLPFAIDAIEMVRDPLGWRSPTTGMRAEPLALESVAPVVRATVPRDAAAAAVIAIDGAVAGHATDTEGNGRYTRRIVSAATPRPARVTLSTDAQASVFTVLAASGAEAGEPGAASWESTGFARSAGGVAGASAWQASNGALRSPALLVPESADTISVLFWTRYDGNPFGTGPRGEVRVSVDGGVTWTIAGSVSGVAEAFYPERVVLPGMAGRTLQVELRAVNMPWRLDEIAIVAHGDVPVPSTDPVVLAASANPVRGDEVWFTWPWPGRAGELLVYDFAGRVAWRVAMDGIEPTMRWPVAASAIRNGVYIAVARSGSAVTRRRVFIARAAR